MVTPSLTLCHKGNRLHHIFDDPDHMLDDLVAKYGGDQVAAYRAIEDSVYEYANKTGVNSTEKWTRVIVNGQEVDATWRTSDGVFMFDDVSRRDIDK